MRTYRHITLLLVAIFGLLFAQAQELVVNIKPVRTILPPQVMLYLSNTGQYFSITLMNNSGEDQMVYFGVDLKQLTPTSDIEVVVPGEPYIPKQPIVVPSGQTKILDAVEMRTLFNHVPSNAVQMPAGLFDNVLSGSFGNLPEGSYEITLHAYKWNPANVSAQLLNNPNTSKCTFNVCYEAQPPQWITPNVQEGELGVYTLSKQNPMFQWMAPIVSCNPSARTFTYDIKIVQLTGMQTPDVAIEKDPVVYQATGLTMPQCLIPTHVINNFSPVDTYVARVTARSNSTQIGSLDYINIVNDGMSDLRLFRVKDYNAGFIAHTTYSAPQLINPAGMNSNLIKTAVINPEDAVIRWKAPVASGNLSQKVNFTYNVRIVEPNSNYSRTFEGMRAALDELPVKAEVTGIKGTEVDMPEEVYEKFNSEKAYLLEVIAVPDTVEGAYKTMTFEDDGRSRPSVFSCLSAIVSPPRFISPKPFVDYDFKPDMSIETVVERVYRDNPVVSWTKPAIQGELPDDVDMTYSIEIVEPNDDYKLNAVDIAKALDELPAVFEVDGIKGTSYRFPDSFFDEISTKTAYLIRVGVTLSGPQSSLERVNVLENGKNDATIVAFSNSSKPTTYSAPKFVSPKPYTDLVNTRADVVYKGNPMIEWEAPVMSGAKAEEVPFKYTLKIVQPTEGYQENIEGMKNAVEELEPVFEKKDIEFNKYKLTQEVLDKLDSTQIYVMRVYAVPDTEDGKGNDYIYQNEGKSVPAAVNFKEGTGANYDAEIIGFGTATLVDSVYNFVNPEIVLPSYLPEEGARKEFLNSDIAVQWRKPAYEGGGGYEPDTVKFVYDVELFCADTYVDRAEMLQREPIYANKGVKELTDTIHWEDISEKVEKGNYMLLRVTPKATNDSTVVYVNDSINIVDFAMSEVFSKRYFQCANQVEITNERPTSMKAAELQGKKVSVGEYELVLDGKLTDLNAPGAIKGTGHVIWAPILNVTWELCVKFDSIVINTDNQVIAGMVLTDKAPGSKMTSSGVVDKLFSDWGIDNLIGDTGIPYANQLQNEATNQVKGLAEDINLATYYEEVTKGYAIIDNLLDNGTIKNVGFPLEIPKKYNPSPVNIQITTMKFAPTWATMDLIGTFVVPETEATKNQILVFGAPRMCISPKSLIPEGGTIALLKDFTVNDPKSDFTLTFKAPEDVIEPSNGCYLVWSENKFAELTADIDMAMPNLKKVDELGNVTDQQPILNVLATIRSWDDWIGSATLDAFQHESLPGFTFEECKVVIDHSSNQNHASCTKSIFPAKYDWEEVNVKPGNIQEWQGVYISKINVSLPKSFSVGNGGRMSMFVENMIFDKSGCSLTAGISNLINYKAGENGSIGGFAFSLDSIYVDVVQNDFDRFKLKGGLQIPLLKDSVHYECNIQPLSNYENGKEGYCYVFRTYQMDKLSFDFILGDLDFDPKLTYFLVEAYDKEDGTTKTNCELCIGGDVTIVGAKAINKQLEKLPFDIHIPGIRFCKMRIANNKSFVAKYSEEAKKMQSDRSKLEKDWLASTKWWNKAEDKVFADGAIYINFGQWGYASPEKNIGPFTLTLTECDIDLNVTGKDAELEFLLGGKITFNKDLEISGETKLGLKSKISNITSLSDMSIEFSSVEFHEATIKVNTGQVDIEGTVKVDDSNSRSGYCGELKMKIVDIFDCTAKGGYYEENPGSEDSFDWGYFELTCGDMSFTPVTIYGVHGGFYFNCYSESTGEKTSKATPKKGAIGIILGMGMKAGGGTVFDGSFDCTVVIYKNPETGKCKLTTFKFNGMVDCVGIVKTQVNIVYENTDKDKYFQLDLTADVQVDGGLGGVLSEFGDGLAKLQELNDKFQGYVDKAEAGLKSVMSDKNSKEEDGSFEENVAKADEITSNDSGGEQSNSSKASLMKWTININLKVTMKKEGKTLESPDWYVYLGVPEPETSRCSFILVDAKNMTVDVSVGANAYICFGSELPNGGRLPALPKKVSEFLDGGEHGAAVSDNISDVEIAQAKVKRDFRQMAMDQELGGGIMLGASVWGYIDVNLGLFYFSAGATAGFDIVLAKMPSNAQCVNFGGAPGYEYKGNNWYARGQLYAYLYCKMGLHINLGFFDKKIDLVDCGVGGLLQCAMPDPNYFTGKMRIKIRLLGGLVNLNKKFSFECGEVCQLFMGNALDNFILFDRCSLGSDDPRDIVNVSQEIRDSLAIDYNKGITPYVVTNADINSEISIVDPTDLEKLNQNSNLVQEDALNGRASRKFKFEVCDDEAILDEFEWGSLLVSQRLEQINDTTEEWEYFIAEEPVSTSRVSVSYQNQKVLLSKLPLKPNRFYRLTIKGEAFEFRNGSYMWPEKWNGKDYEPEQWTQTRSFYFCTKPAMDASQFTDSADLESYAKLAFPCYYTRRGPKLVNDTTIYAPKVDMRCPLISLDAPYKGMLYNNGSLTWRVYKGETIAGKPVMECPNLWIQNDSVSIMTPNKPFEYDSYDSPYVITLDHEWTEILQTEPGYHDLWRYVTYTTSEIAAFNQAVEKIYEEFFPDQSPSKPNTAGYIQSIIDGTNPNAQPALELKSPIDVKGSLSDALNNSGTGSISVGTGVGTTTPTLITPTITTTPIIKTTTTVPTVNAGISRYLSPPPLVWQQDVITSKLGKTAVATISSSSTEKTMAELPTSDSGSSSVDSPQLPDYVTGVNNPVQGAETRYNVPEGFIVSIVSVLPANGDGLNGYEVVVQKYGTIPVPIQRKKNIYKQCAKYDEKTERLINIYGSASYYGNMFEAAVMTEMKKKVNLPKVKDKTLLGGATMASNPVTNDQGQYYIVQEPSMYLDYLANMFFVGGYRLKSTGGYLDIDVTTSEALKFDTPYGYTQGVLAVYDSFGEYQLYDNYKKFDDLCYLKYNRFTDMGVYYPLFCHPLDSMASFMYGDELPVDMSAGVQPWHQLHKNAYLGLISDLYYNCEMLSKDISKEMERFSTAGKATVRDYCNVTAQSYNTWKWGYGYGESMFSQNRDEDKPLFAIKVPGYQYGLVWTGSQQGQDCGAHIYDIVKMDAGENWRHPRVGNKSGSSSNSEWSRLLYEWARPEPHENGFSTVHVEFDGKAALENISELKFMKYRVNAWNFKDSRRCWTIYAGDQGSSPTTYESANTFFGTETSTSVKANWK